MSHIGVPLHLRVVFKRDLRLKRARVCCCAAVDAHNSARHTHYERIARLHPRIRPVVLLQVRGQVHQQLGVVLVGNCLARNSCFKVTELDAVAPGASHA
jgi:hypothetical protein